MKTSIRRAQQILFATLVAGLVGCSHGPVVQEFANTASPTEEIGKLQADINSALDQQVHVLSPHHMKEAQAYLADAKQGLDRQRDSEDILHAVAEGRAYLGQATTFADLAHQNIEDVIVARAQAVSAGAPTLLTKQFRDADEDLEDVTSDIEKNRLDSAKAARSELQLAYLDLELQAIKQSRLNQAREIVALALKEGAKNFAPRTLAIAEKSILDTDAYITASRHQTGEIANRSQQTLASAEHLLKITRDSKSGKMTSPEETALQMESAENAVVSKQSEIDKSAQTNRNLSARNSNLENTQAMDRRYEEARVQFTEKEATVYKQGGTLVVRLKGLEFPVAQAVLKGSNFPLLAKVQNVIQNFGDRATVVVEGHTDSVGGKEANERLSTERAEAVKEYLESNYKGNDLRISAVGYGYQKPLATNKTAAGRAQNRRVDILIQPEASQVANRN